eukprot:3605185-Rhodomonas_salina.1
MTPEASGGDWGPATVVARSRPEPRSEEQKCPQERAQCKANMETRSAQCASADADRITRTVVVIPPTSCSAVVHDLEHDVKRASVPDMKRSKCGSEGADATPHEWK